METDEKDETPKNRGGRPPKLQADAATLRALTGLGQIQATTREGASFFAVSEPTFLKFLKDHEEASAAFDAGKGQGLISLRRTQFAMAKTNATMAIWLGKQHLGQKDKFEGDLNGGLVVNVKRYSDKPVPDADGGA